MDTAKTEPPPTRRSLREAAGRDRVLDAFTAVDQLRPGILVAWVLVEYAGIALLTMGMFLVFVEGFAHPVLWIALIPMIVVCVFLIMRYVTQAGPWSYLSEEHGRERPGQTPLPSSGQETADGSQCLETVSTLDLSDAREVVRRLDLAIKQLAGDRGVPGEVVVLVSEIETALADTGPLEIGVSAADYVMALETSTRLHSKLCTADAVTEHNRTVRGLGKLRKAFRRAGASARASDRAAGRRRAIRVGLVGSWGAAAAVPAGGFVAASTGVLGWPALGFAAWSAFVAMIVVWNETSKRAETTARALMVAATPGERLLLCHRPANIGNLLRRRAWIATDRRLFLAVRVRGDRPVQLLRSVEYQHITAFSHKQSGEGVTRLELHLGAEQLDLRLPDIDAKALLAILCRRTALPVMPAASRKVDWSNILNRVISARRRG